MHTVVQVPAGLSEIASGVKSYWVYEDDLPKTEEEIFEHLVYWTLLSGITNSAQNGYLYKLVEPITRFRKVGDRWSYRARRVLEAERVSLRKRLPKATGATRRALNLKLDAIGKFSDRCPEVNNTLLEAQDVIPRMWETEGRLRKWQNNKRVIDLVTDVAHHEGRYKISEIGYVKATKWLQDCGVGQQIVPPMPQIARFLAEMCNCPELRKPGYEYKYLGGLDEVEMPDAITDWVPMNNRCQELARKISPAWATTQLVGDAIHVVMYARGQLSERRLGRRVTPGSLSRFLKDERINFPAFMDAMYEVDTLPVMASRLEAYLA